MRVTNFEVPHLEKLIRESPEWYKDLSILTPETTRVVGNCPGRTFWQGSSIIACAGLQIIHKGYAQAWLFRGSKTHEQALPLVRQCGALVRLGAMRYRLHRIDCVVPTMLPAWRRFIELVGFHAESVMPRYGPDKSEFMRYVMFPGGQ